MTRLEALSRLRLQLEGLESWPPCSETELMRKWIEKQIAKLEVQ